MIFEYKNVFIFASAVASLFIVALNISTNQEFVEEKEFEVKKEKRRIVDLPPAENVLLATGYRTGSSFLGELFNQNDDVFYVILKRILIKFYYFFSCSNLIIDF